MRVVRSLVAIVIWFVDFALKLVLVAALIGIAWFCVAYPFGFSFGTVWTIASALSGLAIVGLCGGRYPNKLCLRFIKTQWHLALM